MARSDAAAMAPSFTQEYFQIPPVTRTYTTACILTTAAVQLQVISPFHLYFNPELIINRYQIWRLITSFFFFGSLGFGFLFNIHFLYRYCRMLEEDCFRGRTADFVFMFLFGGVLITLLAVFADILFLGPAFVTMLAYVWSKRKPLARMSFLGQLSFQAPSLPWALMGFSLLLGNPFAVDVLGISVGHLCYLIEDVFPNQPGGKKLLTTPELLRLTFVSSWRSNSSQRMRSNTTRSNQDPGYKVQTDQLATSEVTNYSYEVYLTF